MSRAPPPHNKMERLRRRKQTKADCRTDYRAQQEHHALRCSTMPAEWWQHHPCSQHMRSRKQRPHAHSCDKVKPAAAEGATKGRRGRRCQHEMEMRQRIRLSVRGV